MRRLGLAIAATVLAVRVFAYSSETVDGLTWLYTIENEGAVLYGTSMYTASGFVEITTIPKSTVGVVSIPSLLGGYHVTGIGNYAFYGCEKITAIEIPETINQIGSAAFCGCSSLKEIDLPTGISEIPNSAFANCKSLEKIIIPQSVCSIGPWVFESCSKLATVVLPDQLETLGNGAFEGCSSLRSIPNLPSSLSAIPYSAFKGCSSLTEVVIPDGVTSVGSFAFQGCGSLAVVKLPDSLKSIGQYTFSGCGALRYVRMPPNLETIGYDAFENCKSLTTILIPASVSMVEGETFVGCSSLKIVVAQGNAPKYFDFRDAGLSKDAVVYPRRFAASWVAAGFMANNYYLQKLPIVEILSSAIRATDPTVMDVEYVVTSESPTVRVRALAFKNGVRSFANVVRPETFVDGTAANIGDEIVANVPHKLSWRVSADYGIELTKMKFEVIAQEGDLLPMEWIYIPKSDQYGKMKASYNTLSEVQVYDALMWLYAANDPDLSLSGGTLMAGGYKVAQGPSISTAWMDVPPGGYVGYYYVIDYLYSKLGCSVLSGDVLNYAREETRKDLPYDRKGISKCAYKFVD